MDGDDDLVSQVPQNILADLKAELDNMTDYEQAQLANYISQAELTDGFESGLQGLKINGGSLANKVGSGFLNIGGFQESCRGPNDSDGDSL